MPQICACLDTIKYGLFSTHGTRLTLLAAIRVSSVFLLYSLWIVPSANVIAGVIVTKDFLDVLSLHGKTELIGTITAVYPVGCFFGALSTVIWGEKLGRKVTIICGTTIMSIGALLQITPYSVPQMIVGRVVGGIGNGINTATAPVWQGETSQASWRGKLVVIELVMNIAGYALSNWITFAFSFLSGPVAWRFPLAFQFVFILIIYATVPWLPESPRWLITRNRLDEAQKIIADLEAKDVNDSYINTQHGEIVAAVQYEREHGVSWGELFRGRTGDQSGTSAIRRVILGIGAQAMQQLAGINVTSYYLPTVMMSSVGLSNTLARLLTACNGLSYLAAGCFTIPMVERFGRRRLLLSCCAGQFFCYMLITILLRFTEKEGFAHPKQVASASVAFFFLYYVFFGLAFQSITWLLPVELNSLSMRTKGTALSTSTNWIFNFMVVMITPVGIENIGWRFYIIWTVLNCSFLPVIFFFYPETSNRTLEDIDRYFREVPSPFVHNKPEGISVARPARYAEIEQDLVDTNAAVNEKKLQAEEEDGTVEQRENV